MNNENTSSELLPFVASYRASALSLIGAETRKLGLIGKSFQLFEEAVEQYADVSPFPEFLRGGVAENLPWIFFNKRKFAKTDFASIINKYEQNPEYANFKVMSFSYWAWANQHQHKRFRDRAKNYLEKAIKLDPNYEAGRKKAEDLLEKLDRK